MEVQYEIQGGDFSTAGQASSEIKKLLKQFNIDPQIVRRIAIALFEAEVNVVAHAYKGIMKADIEPESIRVIVEDEGPGIEDIEKAMEEGFSTASEAVRQMGFGAGMGLPNIKKNVDEMILTSVPGRGTCLKMKVLF
ncbi:MAG TPA: ATP-binding protein [Dysgonamonadaceae bacterium]|jgi:anti-sigma regulatory factor (Ser/Thr protein kinase)|uniref:ATP-binding protein n=1 Tax=Seramator thermalis TaxID=2496270 RepID=UPI000C716FC6|nr:ATP-binding protein [Seramator thermalis]MBP7180255.1 ATP-binding protein [Dysgonamonadaceae bacterium]MBP9031587.1 ATP-binding protein [Dysgonamonadaceae bacterium]PLB85399.1 anti-sigma regulatory factor [Dysgonamonadaceae bacterium]HOM62741.1 ATP-binding protein [Dysgonamonadaceae bacterium]HOT64814.1 ATP-binding protein [Dysgonamonadaceae bacterium]